MSIQFFFLISPSIGCPTLKKKTWRSYPSSPLVRLSLVLHRATLLVHPPSFVDVFLDYILLWSCQLSRDVPGPLSSNGRKRLPDVYEFYSSSQFLLTLPHFFLPTMRFVLKAILRTTIFYDLQFIFFCSLKLTRPRFHT